MKSAFFAVLLLAAACQPTGPMGEKPLDLSLPGLDGKTVSLSDYKGKVVLVDFWATWCDPCKAEVPELIELQKKLGPKGFVILGASMDEETAEVPKFAKAYGINYPVLLVGSERAPKGWVVPGLPTAYLIAKDGTPVLRLFGSKSVEKLAAEVEAQLAK